jgi:hypothetical protein
VVSRLRLVSWQQLADERPELLVEYGAAPPRSLEVLERPGEDPGAPVLALTDALVASPGVIFQDYLLVDDVHYVPPDWSTQSWSPYTEVDDGWYEYDGEADREVRGSALFVDAFGGWNNFSHFVRETLPYAAIQSDLAEHGIDVPALLPAWAYPSQAHLAGELFSSSAARLGERVRVERLLVAPRQWIIDDGPHLSGTYRVPQRLLRRIAAAWQDVVELQEASPSSDSVYLWRDWTIFPEGTDPVERAPANGGEIDDLLAERGFRKIDPLETPVHEIIRAVASAPVVIGLHGAQMAHVLWANRSATCIELVADPHENEFHLALAAAMDLRAVRVSAQPDSQGYRRVDIAELDKRLDEVALQRRWEAVGTDVEGGSGRDDTSRHPLKKWTFGLPPVRLSPGGEKVSFEFVAEAIVVRDAVVDLGTQTILSSSSGRWEPSELSWLHGGATDSALPRARVSGEFDRAVLAPCANNYNYFHLIYEFCAGLWVASDLGGWHGAAVPVHGEQWVAPMLDEACSAFGLVLDHRTAAEDRVVYVDELAVPRFTIRPTGVDRSYFEEPRWAAAGYCTEFLSALRTSMRADRPINSNRVVVYNPRDDARFRRDERIDQTQEVCAELGVELLGSLFGLSISEQANLFAQIDGLVTIHGAANANLCFLPPKARVVEIFCESYDPGQFSIVADILGLDYQAVRFPATQETSLRAPLEQSPDFSADALSGILQQLVGGVPPSAGLLRRSAARVRGADDLRILMYWDGETSAVDEAREAWKTAGFDVKVFGGADITSILASWKKPDWVDLFDRITIPACRSDVARWILLAEYGGLYVDAHAGPPARLSSVTRVADILKEVELVIFDRVNDRRLVGLNDVCLGVLAARRGCGVVIGFVALLFESLRQQDMAERESGTYVPYNIFALTGGWAAFVHFFDLSDDQGIRPLKEAFAHTVRNEVVIEQHSIQPVVLYAHYGYRASGAHWSERQTREQLFTHG